MDWLQQEFLCNIPHCKAVTLQLGKPLAVVYADAARVSMHKEFVHSEEDLPEPGAGSPSKALKIVKPYI